MRIVITYIKDIDPVPGTYNETVREVWKGQHSSLAHVIVEPEKVTRLHRHLFTEIYIFLSGEGIVRVDDKTQEVEKGEFVVIPSGSAHNIQNDMLDPLEFLVISEPAYDPSVVEILEELS